MCVWGGGGGEGVRGSDGWGGGAVQFFFKRGRECLLEWGHLIGLIRYINFPLYMYNGPLKP